MKAQVRLPKDQVSALRPRDVQLYLSSRGWVAEADGPQAKAQVFHHPGHKDVEVLLPLERSLGDFALRMADVILAVSRIEHRPVWQVLNDLAGPPADVFRFQVAGSVAALGNLPLDEAIKLIEGGRELLRSSALSIVQPQTLHPKRSVKEVDEFLHECRLGQTERGSFVATILAPVPPEIQRNLDFKDDGIQLGLEPFARQVTTRLMQNLDLVSSAIRSGTPNRILEGVPRGVSANLCEALVAMRPPGDESRLDIAVSWARTRPKVPSGISTAVSFPHEDFSIIEEVGRQLRTRAFAKRERYEGPVISVQKAVRTLFPDVAGRMILSTQVGGVTARVRVDLQQEDFARACDALRDGRRVAITGIIRHDVKAREYLLTDPSDFEVLGDT
jgi:hypothetical protein